VLLANFFLFFLADKFGWWTVYYPSYFRPGGWLVTLMWINAVALLLRVVQRAYFVGHMYGWEHALLSIPRMIVGNFINAMAAARAWRLFIMHLITGKRLAWDKTMHDFPTTDQLSQQRKRLGELLLSWQAIDQETLSHALEIQAREKKPLGKILMEQGWLDEGTLNEAIDFQQAGQEAPPPPHAEDKPATT
jgi:adsorption protein B